jgi:hypothetical protein
MKYSTATLLACFLILDKLQSCQSSFDKIDQPHLHMVFYGMYEDFLEYNQKLKDKMIWEDFYSFQKKIKKMIKHDRSIDEKSYIEFVSLTIDFFSKNFVRLLDSQTTEDVEVAFNQLFLDAKIRKHQEFKVVFKELYRLVQSDFFISLATYSKSLEEMFIDLNKLQLEELDLLFTLYAYLLLDHQYKNPNLIYTKTMQHSLEIFKDQFFQDEIDPKRIFDEYLVFRSKVLDLDLKSPFNQVVARIASILQLFKVEEGKILKETLLQLSPDDLAIVVEEFSFSKIPANFVFSNTFTQFLKQISPQTQENFNSIDQLQKVIKMGIPLIAKIIKQQRGMVLRKEMDPRQALQITIAPKKGGSDFSSWGSISFELKKDGTLYFF